MLRLPMALLDLPNELILNIVEYLEQHDVCSILRVDRRLHSLLADYLLRYNIRFRKGRALIWVARKGHLALARRLVDLGADVNRQINIREHALAQPTLLHLAARTGNLAMVKLLLEIGADPYKTDSLGRAALFWAFRGNHELIVREISSKISNLSTFIVDVNHNLTLLHMACSSGLASLIRDYIEFGMDVGASDEDGKTALDYARASLQTCWHPTTDAGKDNIVETMRILVALGADIASAHGYAHGQANPNSSSFGEFDQNPSFLQVGRPWNCNRPIRQPLTHNQILPTVTKVDDFPMLANTLPLTTSHKSAEVGPWSPDNTEQLMLKLSLSNEAKLSPVSPAVQLDPFPSLSNHNYIPTPDNHSKSLWTEFRNGSSATSTIEVPQASQGRRKKKWQPITF